MRWTCWQDAAPRPTRPDPRRRSAGAPKVLLHDHLDGGLRPQTIVDLAAEIGHELPADRRRRAAALVRRGRRLRLAGALPGDLRPHRRASCRPARRSPGSPASAPRTWPRTASSTPRCATPPSSTSSGGLTLDEVVEAVQEGFDAGQRRPAGGRIVVRRCSPRCGTRPARMEIAELADRLPRPRRGRLRHRRRRGGLPAHPAPRRLRVPPARERHFTIHAGEAFGLPSIWQAIQWCGADRLGHGVRIIDDITVDDDGSVDAGPAGRVRPGQAHPAGDVPVLQPADRRGRLDRRAPDRAAAELRFRVTVNTDNRLMSGTSMTDEMFSLVEAFGYTPGRPAVVHGQRDEVGVPALRRAARRSSTT